MLLEKPEKTRGMKTERILRVLLDYPEGELTRYRIAKEANVTEAWCHELLNRYESNSWINDTTVQDARPLFDAWLDARISPTTVDVSLQNPVETITDTGFRHVFTTTTAENKTQGYLFPTTTDVYIDPMDSQTWLRFIQENALIGGGNTQIRVTDEHVFYNSRQIMGVDLVSEPQLVIDLLAQGGPAVEAAENLIERRYK